MSVNNLNKKDAAVFLEKKYNKSFVFISEEYNGINNEYTAYFSDAFENRFKVVNMNGSLADNYLSVVYDTEICGLISDGFGGDIKAFADTSSAYFSSSASFKDVDGYLGGCPFVNVILCFDTPYSLNDVKAVFDDINGKHNAKYAVTVYELNSEDYDSISSYKTDITLDRVKSMDFFWVMDNSENNREDSYE